MTATIYKIYVFNDNGYVGPALAYDAESAIRNADKLSGSEILTIYGEDPTLRQVALTMGRSWTNSVPIHQR